MRPDNTAPIIAAARRRHELTRAKAIQAIRELDHAGTPITFEAVARHAQISRSWLYTQPSIRAELERLRDTTRRAPAPAIPANQRATGESLKTRLQAALERNQALSEDNTRLRRQLARALGDQRTQNSPPSRSSVTIGPR